jgi:type II secretory pathway component PulF
MEFYFKAKDATGHLKEGRVDALSQENAVQLLQARGLIPFKIEESRKIPSFVKEINRIWEGASKKELVVFFRQLSVLIDAKVPLVSAIKTIKDQTDNSFLKLVLEEMSQDIEDGMSFSESMEKHPTVFSTLNVSLIRAGEASGNMQKSVEFVADSIEKNYQLASKIKGALFYPAFIILVASIIGFIVVTFILPKLTAVIVEMGVEIPWYTKVIISFSNFMANFWWAVIAVILGGVIGLIYYLRTEAGKKELDQIELKIPILSRLFNAVFVSRFLDNLSVLLAGGIPVVRALEIVNDVVGNSVYQNIIGKATEEVRAGGNMSDVFEKYPAMPPIVARMIRVGEESGKLSEILKKTSAFYEEEIENITRSLASLIEPVLIVILGIGVAIMVFSILLPIYNIAGQIQ